MNDPGALIRKYCANGDQAAFRLFYRAQSPRLWKFLLARGCDPEGAYDLVAEAFLRFIQTVCRDPRAPVALLYRIAINLHTDTYRHQRASPINPAIDIEDLEALAGQEPDEYGYVRSLVKTISESEQNLLLLRYWIGLTHKEVARVLEIPEGTVRRRCAQALAALRIRWKDDEGRYGTG